jgi:hypothetical protein
VTKTLEGTFDEPLYLWQQAYIEAACGADDDALKGKVYAALSAIEERRLSPISDPEEESALAMAFDGLQTLIAENFH